MTDDFLFHYCICSILNLEMCRTVIECTSIGRPPREHLKVIYTVRHICDCVRDGIVYYHITCNILNLNLIGLYSVEYLSCFIYRICHHVVHRIKRRIDTR